MSSVLFVCLGNICRSPLAEGVFRQLAGAAGLDLLIDSAGTGDWHIGHAPDPRSQAVAARHGVDISGLRARQLTADDFSRFAHIIVMDDSNRENIRAWEPERHVARVNLLLDFVPGRAGEAVPDPYYGGPEDFEETYRLVRAGAEGLLRAIVGGGVAAGQAE